MPVRRFCTAFIALMLAFTAFDGAPLRAASTTVVISEFRVRGPNGGSDEFIELYNVSASPVSIGGWLVRGSNNVGTTSTRATIAAGVILNPGCHYLLTNSSASGGPYSGAVPGDQTYATGITDDGGIGLLSDAVTVVDQVGMSAGSAYKEGTPLASLGSTNANRGYARAAGADTDDNVADFALASPSDPQNVAGCGAPIGAGAAEPNPVLQGGTTLLTVAAVTGTPPNPITGVTADLTLLGGANPQTFYDDGTHGDATAGDATYSFLATVPAATPAGVKNLPVFVADSAFRVGRATIALTVQAPPPPFVEIHDIQGPGTTSPFENQAVTTRGIVTAVRFNNGFFIQEPDSGVDADPNTSEGVFVFTSSAPPAAAAVGNLVDVTGTVSEFIPSSDPNSPPETEIGAGPAVALVSSGNPLPAPIVLTAADTDPAGSIDELERFEGMRVHVDALTAIAPTQGTINEANATSSSNGVFYGVITGVARPFREPGVQVPDALPAGSPAGVPRFDANPERLRVDSNGQIQVSGTLEVTTGAVVSNMTGVLDYGARTYTILPDALPDVAGVIGAIPVAAPDARTFTVATANVERFFDTTNDPDTSDAVLTATAFANRLNKVSLEIRDVMRSPDIVGVEEMENLDTLQAVAAKLNADTIAGGAPDPQYVAYLDEGNDIGGIDVGLLVKTSRVTVVDVTQEGKDTTYIDPNTGTPAILNDRPPLVLRAIVGGPDDVPAPITVIVNHLRSLSGVDDPVDGNRVRVKRAAQAEWLASLIQARQAANPGEQIISVGDYNAFQFSDGYADVVGTIKGAPAPADQVVVASPDLVDPDLVDLLELAPADERYSYSFDGSAQELDHVLVTQNVLKSFLGISWGRTNADFPESFRNDPNRPERLSDHDPVVTYYRLKAVTTTTAFEAPNPAGLGATVTLAATVTSPGGTVSDGVVTFSEGATALGTAPVVGGTATLSLTTLGLGAHTVTASYGGADLFGASASGDAAFTVADLEPPIVAGLTVHPGSIWPPNDELRRVRVTPSVTDDVDVQPSCAITGISAYDSDHDRRHGRHEPQRPGHAEEDSRITGALTAELRAERGNIYSITVVCTDAAGNAATGQATVAVRHDRDRDRDGRDDSGDRDRR